MTRQINVYGLPEHCAYPLDTREDIQNSIRAFCICRPADRLKLINNITNRIRLLNKLSLEDSKYRCDVLTSKFLPKEFISEINGEYEEELYYGYKDFSEFYSLLRKLKLPGVDVSTFSVFYYDNIEKNRKAMNKVVTKKSVIEMMKTYKPEMKDDLSKLGSFFNHISSSIEASEHYANLWVYGITRRDTGFNNSFASDILERYRSNRNNEHCVDSCRKVISQIHLYDWTVRVELIKSIAHDLNRNEPSVLLEILLSTGECNGIEFGEQPLPYIHSNSKICSKVEAHVENIKDEISSLIPVISRSGRLINKTETDLYMYHRYIYNNTNELNIDALMKYLPKFDISLNPAQYLFMEHDRVFSEVYERHSLYHDYLIGMRHHCAYLIGQIGDNNKIVAIPIYQPNFMMLPEVLNTGCKLSVKTFSSISKEVTTTDMRPVKEGIEITGDGDVIFTFSPKKSYMDHYAENHKILVENNKNKNFEAMKINLAYLFTMINSIEREIIYSDKKVDFKVKKDAEKARVFAMNDFKTFLKPVQASDRNFNFSEYYIEKGYDKYTFSITQDNIKGIKKLLSNILI